MSQDLLNVQPAAMTDPTSPLAIDLAAAQTARPSHIPEKFWDAKSNQLRTDALLKSYQELERRLTTLTKPQAAGTVLPPDRAALLKALGVPDSHEDYTVNTGHGLFQADPAINQRLHAAGLTHEQLQLVYDLAAERFVPLVHEMAAQFEADNQLRHLINHFGGEDKWREASRQMLAWGKKNLPPSALEALSTTVDGIMAIHKLMGGGEPSTLRPGSEPSTGNALNDLHAQMRDPRYWRDRNPDVVAKVTDGFQRLYPTS
ncbi:MAG: hypothetical protein WCK65_14445 [Rhodospirillaceae bacterium]